MNSVSHKQSHTLVENLIFQILSPVSSTKKGYKAHLESGRSLELLELNIYGGTSQKISRFLVFFAILTFEEF